MLLDITVGLQPHRLQAAEVAAPFAAAAASPEARQQLQRLLSAVPGVLKACRKLPTAVALRLVAVAAHPSLFDCPELSAAVEGMASLTAMLLTLKYQYSMHCTRCNRVRTCFLVHGYVPNASTSMQTTAATRGRRHRVIRNTLLRTAFVQYAYLLDDWWPQAW